MNIWLELTNNHKHVLFGLFYSPPNSNSNYFSDIEDSIALAVDSPGISEIIITGDFNLKTWKFVISKLCNPYLVQ